jgi:AmmeMemoRadiSam system protein B
MLPVRRAAVAGSWYPADPDALAREVDRYLAAAGEPPAGDPIAIIAPHAGLVYSGPIAAHAYNLLHGREIEVVVLVGPSHYVGFDGVAVYERGAFDTPFGPARVTHVNLNDNCVEGLALLEQPGFSVQYHPEAAAGPHDAAYLFDRFVDLLEESKN